MDGLEFIEMLKVAFDLEVANEVMTEHNALNIKLTDGSKAKIEVGSLNI